MNMHAGLEDIPECYEAQRLLAELEEMGDIFLMPAP